ncbi:MAG: leucyl aminopeptidase [Boseongicola sp.]|nr:leucyl aminopeptidase [Boseongicola sp.]
MTDTPELELTIEDLDSIAGFEGEVAIFVSVEGGLDRAGRRVNRLTKGAIERAVASSKFQKAKAGDVLKLSYPTGMAADAVSIVKLDKRVDAELARTAGASVSKALGGRPLLALCGSRRDPNEIALGLLLGAYNFSAHKTGDGDDGGVGQITVAHSKPEENQDKVESSKAVAEGVYFTRDLVNEPSNVLTTVNFADRLKALSKVGLKVSVLEEDQLEKLGMRALLGVGQGSRSPSKVVVMEWNGGGDEPPLALVGKGVVFDTGGISLKPAGGMEDMTMDMGGAGVVSGVMKTLAHRKAPANVIGLVGLVENMPDGAAQRPGDVVRTMKGDTVEVINTDAEGRLVLCDVMWHAQEKYKPAAMIDLATLTGAVVIALGHHNAGVFSNDDALANAFLRAAGSEGEGAWRMPLGDDYAKQLKSRVADLKNVGGRPGGSVTAAEFLHRFVQDETPWIHLDIAGVTLRSSATSYAPKGASGWGVMSLNRLIADKFEVGE